MGIVETTVMRTELKEALGRAGARARAAEGMRWTMCRERAARLGLDPEREGTACQGCRHDLSDGCPRTANWPVDSTTGKTIVMCLPQDLVYCKHYDCGCPVCAAK